MSDAPVRFPVRGCPPAARHRAGEVGLRARRGPAVGAAVRRVPRLAGRPRRGGPSHGGLTLRQIAMLDFALKIAGTAHAIDEDEYAALERHGFTREDGWDIAALTGFFALSNRLAGAGDLRPNEEFFTLGQ